MIYLLTAIGLSPGGSSTVHIYIQYTKQTIHRTTQQFWRDTTIWERHKNLGETQQFGRETTIWERHNNLGD